MSDVFASAEQVDNGRSSERELEKCLEPFEFGVAVPQAHLQIPTTFEARFVVQDDSPVRHCVELPDAFGELPEPLKLSR